MAGLGRHVRRALRLSALALFSTLATPASAQWFGPEAMVGAPDPINPGEVIRLLARRGYDEFTRPRFTGGSYVVDATDRRGDRVRVVVDAHEGEIRRIRLLEEERLTGGPPRGRVEYFEDRRSLGRFEEDDRFDDLLEDRQALRDKPGLRPPIPPAARPVQPPKTAAAKPKKPEAPAVAVSPAAPAPEIARKPDPTPAGALGLQLPELPVPPVIDVAPAEKPSTEARAPVRVIEGVTPMIPQDGPKAE